MTKNWECILKSIDSRVKILQSISLTIYQRAVVVNCIINAKLWYLSHIYPLSINFANKIKRLTYHYVWGKKCEPVRRTTITLPKNKGGLGIIDIFYKSQSILVSSFLKSYMNENGILYMIDYYNYIRTNRLLNVTSNSIHHSFVGTVYYRETISIVQKCTHIRKFPNISAKIIYKEIMPKNKPIIEESYGLYNWKQIWNNLASNLILHTERETLFKYLHEILPTKKRLKDIRYIPSATCDHCPQEESNIHVVYQCSKYKEVSVWFSNILKKLADIDDPQFIRLSFMEIPKMDIKAKNAAIFMLSTYIVSMWQARQSNMDHAICVKHVKSCLIKKIGLIKLSLGEKIKNKFSMKICDMKWSDL